jgi:glutamyl-tRNA reductase
VDPFYQAAQTTAGIHDCLLLQTCNRVEVWSTGATPQALLSLWRRFTSAEGDLLGSVVVEGDEVALTHLLRLVSGLESLVVGEPQILGQVRRALEAAAVHRTASSALTKLFGKALAMGRQIRRSTGLHHGVISLGGACARLLEVRLGKPSRQRVLLIGAGETATLVAKALQQRRVRTLYVAARRFQRAQEFTRTQGGVAVSFRRAIALLPAVDAVIVASSAPHYVVTTRHVQRLPRNRARRLLLLDLSAPLNIDPRVGSLSGVELRSLEDLRQIVEAGMRERRVHVQAAQALIESRLDELKAFFRRMHAEPTIRQMYRGAEQIRQVELGRALGRLNGLAPDAVRTIQTLTQSIVEGILARPTAALRHAAATGDERVLAAANRLFGSAEVRR